MAETVEIIDVAARDGLQNESVLLPTAVKVELIERLVAAGLRRVETTSFVNPKKVPAMADAEAVMAALTRPPGVQYIGLALNERGGERAIGAGCHEIAYALPATDGFSMANQGTTVSQAIGVWGVLARQAADSGVAASLVVSVAFGCPYEGEVARARVIEVLEAALTASVPSRLSLADTIGVGAPRDVRERYRDVAAVLPPGVELGSHFHNTRNTGFANAYAAWEAGVRSFDASLGGIGGCPFAPNATGNIATEDLTFMFHRMGVQTGLDLEGLAEAARWLHEYLGPSVVGLYSKAGPFPRLDSLGDA